MVTPQRLVSIGLIGAQLNQVSIEYQGGAIPEVTIHMVSEQRHVSHICRIDPGAAFGPIEIHETIYLEVWMQGEAQQPALRSAVDCEIKHRALQHTVDYSLNSSRVLLEHEKVIRADKGHAGR